VTAPPIVAEFSASSVVAVPVLLDPLVVAPTDCTSATSVVGSVEVAAPSPSGTGYAVELFVNGVSRGNVATFVEVVGTTSFGPIALTQSIASTDQVELKLVPTYAPTGVVAWSVARVYLELTRELTAPACNPNDAVTSALTEADLMAVLASSSDTAYLTPILEAGDGNGLEVYGQAIAQFVRLSEAIERTQQAMFVAPWSGQTGVEANAGRGAQVPLLFTRVGGSDRTLAFDASIKIGELETEATPDGGEEVLISRFYQCENAMVFNPGESGDRYVRGVAERVGYGYNNPRPNTLRSIDNADASYGNTGARVIVSAATVKIVSANNSPVFHVGNVGQYVQCVAGTNIGKIARIVSYEAPDPAVSPYGSAVVVERLFVARCPVFAGTFAQNEAVFQPVTGATGTILRQSGVEPYFTISVAVTSAAQIEVGAGRYLLGASGAFAVLDPAAYSNVAALETPTWVAETGTCSWQILGWDVLGLSVTNPVSPTGGRAAWLDCLGRERGVYRADSEDDASYRARTIGLSDTVSPMALKREVVRKFGTLGTVAGLLEIGTLEFPGFFYDVDPGLAPDYAYAYDFDLSMRPTDRYRCYMSLYEMRGFFAVVFSATPNALLAKQLWASLDRKRAAGVSFAFWSIV
jgi:hypothetical protein